MRLIKKCGLIFAAAAVTVAIAACSDSSVSPLRPSYTLKLHEDSAGVYGVGHCSQGLDSYCWEWRPSTAVTQVSLIRTTDADFLIQTGDTLDTKFTLDSLPFLANNISRYGCKMLTMRIAQTDTGLRGTWSEQMDCHGRLAMGTVTGVRD